MLKDEPFRGTTVVPHAETETRADDLCQFVGPLSFFGPWWHLALVKVSARRKWVHFINFWRVWLWPGPRESNWLFTKDYRKIKDHGRPFTVSSSDIFLQWWLGPAVETTSECEQLREALLWVWDHEYAASTHKLCEQLRKSAHTKAVVCKPTAHLCDERRFCQILGRLWVQTHDNSA